MVAYIVYHRQVSKGSRCQHLKKAVHECIEHLVMVTGATTGDHCKTILIKLYMININFLDASSPFLLHFELSLIMNLFSCILTKCGCIKLFLCF